MKYKLLVLLFVGILLLGCIGKPQIKGISSKWGKVTESTTQILTDVKIYNPNPFPIPIKNIVTNIYMNGIKMGSGSALKAGIAPQSTSTVVLSTIIDNNKIPEWWVSHIRNGERTTITIKGYFVLDLKLFSINLPFDYSNEIKTNILSSLSTNKPETISVGPISLTIESINSYWGKVTENYTEIVSKVKIRNNALIPIPVTKFDYTIKMNGITIGEGTNYVSTILQPRSTSTLILITKINNDKIPEWWVSHIRNGEKTVGEILIQPYIKVGGQEFKFTLIKKEFEFKTNLLKSI